MSAKAIDDGGPAFPFPARIMVDPCDAAMQEKICAGNNGMSLRDYFAAQAIGPSFEACGILTTIYQDGNLQTYEALARMAYSMADAMLVERRKAPEEPAYVPNSVEELVANQDFDHAAAIVSEARRLGWSETCSESAGAFYDRIKGITDGTP